MTNYQSLVELIDALNSPERRDCLNAAQALGKLFVSSDDAPLMPAPTWSEAFSILLRADKNCHGVADAFWGEVQFDCDEYGKATSWMLDVLKQRGPVSISDISCNDLEFHVHESFDSNAGVLTELMNLGFDTVVTMALDHGALSIAEDKAIRGRAIETNREPLITEAVLGLFLRHKIIHPIGITRGIIKEHNHPSGKKVIGIDYRRGAGRGPHLFLYSQDKEKKLSIAEMWQMLDALVPSSERGSEITREAATQSGNFSLVPNIPANEALSKFFENGYAATVFGIGSDHSAVLRVDFPKS